MLSADSGKYAIGYLGLDQQQENEMLFEEGANFGKKPASSKVSKSLLKA